MKTFKLLALILCLMTSHVLARDIKAYKGDITVPILENDTDFARNNAFQSLQSLLLSAAIQDLIGHSLYEEFKFQISKNKKIRPSNFLVSAKVINESSDGENFNMTLEGKIQLTALSDAIRKMGLLVKSDPWFDVSVLLESNLDLSSSDIKKRVGVFHVRVKDFIKLSLDDIEWQRRSSAEFVEALFNQVPRSKVVIFIDSIPEVIDEGEEFSEKIESIRVQIFRRSDLAQISIFQLNLAAAIHPEEINDSTNARFLRMFSLQSLKSDLYDAGIESTLFVEVEGLVDPYTRSIFESRIFGSQRAITSWVMTKIGAEKAKYQIKTKFTLDELNAFFKKKNEYFYFITDRIDSNLLNVEAFHRFSPEITELNEWEPKEEIIEMIKESMMPKEEESTEIVETEQSEESEIEFVIDESLIPRFIENEPNNSSKKLNSVPSATLFLGYVSSRADEDIFQISRNVDSTTLVVEWTRIGKTNLSPQLRLYDRSFNYLNNYSLIGSQNQLKFHYTFNEGAPRKLFLRVTDKIGFIQGETGGFKSFYYTLKYSWQINEISLNQ